MYSWIHLILAVAYENLPLLLRKCCYEMHGEGIESTQITYCRRLIHLDAFINLTRSRYRVLKLSDVIYYINHDFLQAHYTKRKARYYLKMMFLVRLFVIFFDENYKFIKFTNERNAGLREININISTRIWQVHFGYHFHW